MKSSTSVGLALLLSLGLVSCRQAEEPLQNLALAELGPEVLCNEKVFGLNFNVRHALVGDAMERAIRYAQPTVIRYPGGTWSACWDWRQQNVFPKLRIVERMRKEAVWLEWIMPEVPNFAKAESKWLSSPERFASAAESVGVELSWVVNFNSDSVQSAFEMLEDAAEKGLPVRYIELGNEYNGRSFDQRFPTVEDYLEDADRLIALVRERFPDAKLAYPSNIPVQGLEDADQTETLEPWQEREHAWDRSLAERSDGVDIVDHHYYGFPPHRSEENAQRFARFESLSESEQVAHYLVGPQVMLAGMNEFLDGRLAEGKKVWFTEYNMWLHSGPTAKMRDTMANALYLASWKLQLLLDSRVEMAVWHSMLGHTFGFMDAELENGLSISPAVEVFSELSRLARSADRVAPVQFTGLRSQVDPLGSSSETFDTVQGVCFISGQARRYVLVNLGHEEVAFLLGAEKGNILQGYCLKADEVSLPLRRVLGESEKFEDGKGILERIPVEVGRDGGFSLQPYSVTLF